MKTNKHIFNPYSKHTKKPEKPKYSNKITTNGLSQDVTDFMARKERAKEDLRKWRIKHPKNPKNKRRKKKK